MTPFWSPCGSCEKWEKYVDCFAKDFGKFSSFDFHELWEWALLNPKANISVLWDQSWGLNGIGDCIFSKVQNIFNGLWWVQSWSHTSKLEHGLFQVFLSENAIVSVPKWVWFIFLTTNAYFAFSESSPCCCRVFQSQNTQQFSSKSCFTGARCVEIFSGN